MIKNIILRFALFLLVVSYKVALSQGFTWNVYNQKDGIKDLGTISEIIQDEKGYLWFVNDNRITRFDGIHFKSFMDKSNLNGTRYTTNLTGDKDGVIYFNSAIALSQFNPNTNSFSYFPNDSIFSYLYFPKYEAYKYFHSYLNNDLYRVLIKDRTKSDKKLSDTLFYQYNNQLKWVLLPKKLKRTPNDVIQDHYKNIYISLRDTVLNKTQCFFFDKGKISKIFVTDIINCKIVKDNSNNFWCYGNNKIECYKKEVLIKQYFLKSKELDNFSDPLVDSKNNVWISVYYGLVKINPNSINYYKDPNRHVTEYMEASYDPNGIEKREYKKSFLNFYTSFVIDKFDNIISGERVFDGNQFANISDNVNFRNAFDNIKKENLPYLYTCFVDRENNIWYGSNLGLIKASPIPFKKTDDRLSFSEPDYKLVGMDKSGIKYYERKDELNSKVSIKVSNGDSVTATRNLNTFKNFLDVQYQPCYKGMLFTYKENAKTIKLTYIDSKTETSVVLNDKTFMTLSASPDTAFYFNDEYLIMFTNGIFTKIKNTIGPRLGHIFSFNNSSRIILTDFTEVRVNKNLSLDTLDFLSLKGNTVKDFSTDFRISGKHLFKLGDESYILMTNMHDAVKLKNISPDSIKNEISKLRADGGVLLNDILIISGYRSKKGYYLFKVDRTKKQISFIRTLSIADGLIDVYFNHFYYQNNYVFHFNENRSGFKIIKFDDFVNGDFSKGYEYENHHIFLDGQTIRNKFGEEITSGYISYLGERGFNSVPPSINFTNLSYVNGKGIIHEWSYDQKNVNLKYDIHDINAEFQGICLTDGSKLKYKTRLLGLDSTWQERTSEFTYVRYPTLSPGSYTFQVTACNNNGIWNQTPAEFSFTILPPWYRTWYAYACYALAFFASIRGYIRNRTKKLEKEKKKLEKVIEERTAEVVMQKHLVEEKNKEMVDSITYAKRIQRSLMPTDKYISRILGRKK